MARLPPTAEDRARGVRLKALRDRLGKTQDQVFPGQHQQVLGAEKGRNKLTGKLVRRLAAFYETSIEQLESYANGEISLERFLAEREAGIMSTNQKHIHIKQSEEDERDDRAQARARALAREEVPRPLDVVSALHSLDGVPLELGMKTVSDINMEHGSSLQLYVQARLNLAALAGQAHQKERVVRGADVSDRQPSSAGLLSKAKTTAARELKKSR